MTGMILAGKKTKLLDNGNTIALPSVAVLIEYRETLYGPFPDEDAALTFGSKLENPNWRVRIAYTPE